MIKNILIAILIVFSIGLVGCNTVSEVQDEFINAISGEQFSNAVPISSSKEVVDRVYASNTFFDTESIKIDSGDFLELEIVSKDNSYFTLDNNDYRVFGFEIVEISGLKTGKHVLECSFKCDQADLAKEYEINVN